MNGSDVIITLSKKCYIHHHKYFWNQSLVGLKALYRGEKPDRLVGRLLLGLSQVTMGTTSWALASRLYQRTSHLMTDTEVGTFQKHLFVLF